MVENKNKTLQLRHIIAEAEKKAIISALEIAKNNRTEAARILGISRRTLYDKIEIYMK